MGKIIQLDRLTADLIAAGEVVERPASAVKELVENSIDAGASSITIEIRSGGMEYIRVTDNGCGMSEEDSQTSLLRHATSKLSGARGLEAIATLGFRGEALAAISAVSRIDIYTCDDSSSEGTHIFAEAGNVSIKEPAGLPKGTTVIVRNLFYNTPARLKFMKTDKAEGAAVTSYITALALCRPDISFRYIKDGKSELHTYGDGNPESCIYNIFGREIHAELLSAETESNGIHVSGYISSPACARGNRSMQYFFVNGRYIKSRSLQTALEQAYRNSLFTGKYPVCFLYISLPCNKVDVNVHPTKTEVKFSDEHAVFDSVYHAALAALEKEKAGLEVQNITAHQTENKGYPTAGIDYIPATAAEVRKRAEKENSIPFSEISVEITNENAVKAAKISNSPKSTENRSYGSPVFETEIKHSERLSGYGNKAISSNGKHIGSNRISTNTTHGFQQYQNASRFTVQTSESEKEQTSIECSDTGTASFIKPLDFKILGEAMQTYIIVEYDNRLWLIDKHAAHERIQFDRLKALYKETMVEELLVPIICRMTQEDTAVLMENEKILSRIGFTVEAFGTASVAIRALPSHIDASQAEGTISEICAILKSGGTDPSDGLDEILHTVACKAAIKAGAETGQKELEKLTERVLSGEIRYCPHGRPVAIEFSKQMLDKYFKRT